MDKKALGNMGEIEFVYAEKNSYPLAYLRTSGDEKVLVVINPSSVEAGFECELETAGCLYSLGGELKRENGRIVAMPNSACFYRVK